MSTAGDSIELFGPLSELHVHGGGWKLLDASETSGPRDSHSFCFDASRRAGQNCALGCAKVESPQCPLLQSTVYYRDGVPIENYILHGSCSQLQHAPLLLYILHERRIN